MAAFYNEIDPYAAQWLRNLIERGYIADGVVEERSIVELQPGDLEGYDQVHLFAGIGVWSYALRLAGWPDDRPVWTGSCPCQPFSSAGKRKGTNDERHLWPHFFRLLEECRPPVVLGEQVASKDGLAWLDLVSADLEGADYAVGAADLCAAGVGAPHIRQRLFWVAHSKHNGHSSSQGGGSFGKGQDEGGLLKPSGVRDDGGVGQPGSDDLRRDGRAASRAQGQGGRQEPGTERDEYAVSGGPSRVGNPNRERREGLGIQLLERGSYEGVPQAPRASEGRSYWDPVDWVLCRDPGGPRWRPVEPGPQQMVDGAPARVGRLRAYGNAIVAPLAAEFIQAVTEST